MTTTTGYTTCACPTCWAGSITVDGDLCAYCEEAGCDCEGECAVVLDEAELEETSR